MMPGRPILTGLMGGPPTSSPPLYTPYFDGVKGGDDSLIKIFRKKIQKFEIILKNELKNFLKK
jgi:putative IMPACT (imprinted ancient) family translation regulator